MTSQGLLLEMGKFVRDESLAQRDYFQKLWEPAIPERVEEGRCIEGLEFAGEKPVSGLQFLCKQGNHSEFREGDLVRLSRGEAVLSVFDATIFRIEEEAIWLVPEDDWKKAAGELQYGLWVLDRSYLDLSGFVLKAIGELGSTARGREKILPLLTGEGDPGVDNAQFHETAEKMENEDVNISQLEAISQGVAAEWCHLVQGPPGTGKTYVLAKIAHELFLQGERILITGPTHLAIHNALNMIRRLSPEITQIAKIGVPIHAPDLMVEQYENFRDSPLAHWEGAFIVGATPFTARSQRLMADFHTVIIDEASQITLPLAAMAMLSADKYLFIGDHRQLPPVVQSLRPMEAAQASVFQRMQNRGVSTMLSQTYRMNAALTRWPSENFYDGRLQAAAANAARRLVFPQPVRDFQAVLDPDCPLVMIELEHAGAFRKSDDEASLVANLLEQLYHAGIDLKNIAVVVPFRRQARRIRWFLTAKSHISPHDWSDCVIDTVERMQGQEREVVIISMTASEPTYLQKTADFLLLPQRLNVAVTRARSKVILLASSQIARLDSGDPEINELIALWRSLRFSATVFSL